MLVANCEDLYTLEEINIETDSELLERYRYEIPVIAIDGVEAFRYRWVLKNSGQDCLAKADETLSYGAR